MNIQVNKEEDTDIFSVRFVSLTERDLFATEKVCYYKRKALRIAILSERSRHPEFYSFSERLFSVIKTPGRPIRILWRFMSEIGKAAEGRARRSRNYPLDAFPWSEEQEEI